MTSSTGPFPIYFFAACLLRDRPETQANKLKLTLANSSLLSDFCHFNEKKDKAQTKIANQSLWLAWTSSDCFESFSRSTDGVITTRRKPVKFRLHFDVIRALRYYLLTQPRSQGSLPPVLRSERERPWKTLVTCLPESGRLQTNDLGEGQVSVRFVSTERRQLSAAIKLCTWPDLERGK